MQRIVNGFNLVASQPFDRSAEQDVHEPYKRERVLLPSMVFPFTGWAAFRKLEKYVEEVTETTDDSLDVVVILLPENLAIREIRYTEANTVFLCDSQAANKFRAISIRNGHTFGAAIDIFPKRSQTRLVTQFTDQSYSDTGLVE